MSSNEYAIRVQDLTKHYLMYHQPEDRLKQMIVPRLQKIIRRQPKQYFQDFAALNGISFDVKRGHTVGIIGRNGCGKSTLLQIICGTLQPSTGQVDVNGRIAALLELGAGFNPEFTGRENVFMNAAILGLSRSQTEARFDEIARFADIGIFIDQPVKTYSSGMYVRLAFAVAINVDPDILVIDEALAVGDEAFQRKCFARIEQIKENGATILFVSHSAQSIVQLCDTAIFLDRGEKILEGRPKLVVNQYQRFMNLSGVAGERVREEIKSMDGWAMPPTPQGDHNNDNKNTAQQNSLATTSGEEKDESFFDPNLTSQSMVEYEHKGVTISNVRITTLQGRQVNVLQCGKRYLYRYTVNFEKDVERVGFGMLIKTINGTEIGGAATDFTDRLKLQKAKVGSKYEICFDLCWRLNPGTFFLNAGVTGVINDQRTYVHRMLDAHAFRILPKDEVIATGAVCFDAKPSFTQID